MTTRIGINGFGRIGRLVARLMLPDERFELVHVNETGPGGVTTAAHLLQFDSVHGQILAEVEAGTGPAAIVVDGHPITFSTEPTPATIDWDEHDVDIVIESSGAFRTTETLRPHLDNGAEKVIVAAPVKSEGVPNIVVGCNDDVYDPDRHDILTAASCTTNCIAPVVKVLHERIGIERGAITTIHDVTNTQVVVDAPHADLRRARSSLTSLIPTTTGSATAITMIYPELLGKLNGVAVRVPLLNASLTDAVFTMTRDVTVEEINGLFAEAATGELAGVLGYEERPLVSADYTNDTRSGIVDAASTMVVDDRLVKVLVWYDNEMGYAARMVDLAAIVATRG